MLTDFQFLQFLVHIRIARNLYGVILQAIFACMTFKCEQIYYLVLNLCVLLKFMFTGKALVFPWLWCISGHMQTARKSDGTTPRGPNWVSIVHTAGAAAEVPPMSDKILEKQWPFLAEELSVSLLLFMTVMFKALDSTWRIIPLSKWFIYKYL